MLLCSISKWFYKNQSAWAFFFFGLTYERLLNVRTKAFFIPHVMLFVAPDGKCKSWYKISGAMKHNGRAVCHVSPSLLRYEKGYMGEMGHNGCWDCVRSRHGKATSKFHRPTIGLHVEYREFNFSKDMKINIWYSNQIGIMLTWGVQYEGRKYVSLDIPFLIIQVLSAIPKKLNEGIRESDHRERT